MSIVDLVRAISVILLFYVRNVNVGFIRSTLASHKYNFNVNVQYVSVSFCGRPRSDFCFHNCANGVKSSKTVRDLSFSEDVITDFYSKIISEPIKSVLPCKSVDKSLSSKRLSRTSVMYNLICRE